MAEDSRSSQASHVISQTERTSTGVHHKHHSGTVISSSGGICLRRVGNKDISNSYSRCSDTDATDSASEPDHNDAILNFPAKGIIDFEVESRDSVELSHDENGDRTKSKQSVKSENIVEIDDTLGTADINYTNQYRHGGAGPNIGDIRHCGVQGQVFGVPQSFSHPQISSILNNRMSAPLWPPNPNIPQRHLQPHALPGHIQTTLDMRLMQPVPSRETLTFLQDLCSYYTELLKQPNPYAAHVAMTPYCQCEGQTPPATLVDPILTTQRQISNTLGHIGFLNNLRPDVERMGVPLTCLNPSPLGNNYQEVYPHSSPIPEMEREKKRRRPSSKADQGPYCCACHPRSSGTCQRCHGPGGSCTNCRNRNCHFKLANAGNKQSPNVSSVHKTTSISSSNGTPVLERFLAEVSSGEHPTVLPSGDNQLRYSLLPTQANSGNTS